MRVQEYIVTVLKLWWGKHLSGPILALVGLALPLIARYCTAQTAAQLLNGASVLSGTIAVFLILVAQ